MTKKEFVELFRNNAGIKTFVKADEITNAFISTLEEVLEKDESILFRDFGKLEVYKRATANRVNPQTRERIKVEGKKVVRFKAGKILSEKMNAKKLGE